MYFDIEKPVSYVGLMCIPCCSDRDGDEYKKEREREREFRFPVHLEVL